MSAFIGTTHSAGAPLNTSATFSGTTLLTVVVPAEVTGRSTVVMPSTSCNESLSPVRITDCTPRFDASFESVPIISSASMSAACVCAIPNASSTSLITGI